MNRRRRLALVSALICGAAAWLGSSYGDKPTPTWEEAAPGVWRSREMPYGHALVADGHALLIDAPHDAGPLKKDANVTQIDAILLTHHHLDNCARAADFLAAKVPVRAPKSSADWLLPAQVKKFWQESIPLRNSRTAYFVLPVGIDVDCSLEDGQVVDWRGWTVRVVATPGHSRDHVSFLASRGTESPLLFAGDALAAPGKLWTPYTTDWDHWTDAGLTPAAKSLRTLAGLRPKAIFPAHGAPILRDTVAALEKTAANVEEVAFLKSFERFSKQRMGNAPSYPFLVPKEQVASAGEKPWAKVSEHLWITGNTYVLISKDDKGFAVIDPWGKRSADQIAKLKADLGLGKLELVMFSHAHFDHYDGVYELPGYAKDGPSSFQIWSLDEVAAIVGFPMMWRAPFLDARPVRFDRRLKDGESASWREYGFKFHWLPGQSRFTMGVETTIVGKRCYFTADNFFHQDQFSGSGGWMGLNRSFPLPYAASAKKVLDAAPHWVLAEHGGPFEFNAEDFRRRVKWGAESAIAADAVCVSGHHERNWNPYRVQAVPVVQKASPGAAIAVTITVSGGERAESLKVDLAGRNLIADREWEIETIPGQQAVVKYESELARTLPRGRHVFPLRTTEGGERDAIDAFFVIDVE
ncbi:MAG: MBL fold metallo-hydrolase [Gemmataceae bacterium]